MELARGTRDEVGRIQDETQLVRLQVRWTMYEDLVAALADDSHVLLAYDGEALEIMSPGFRHEKIARFIAAIVVYALDAWDIDYEDAGSTTFRRQPVGGFEGDASFYTAKAEDIRGVAEIDLALHPAPDLILEVDIANRRMDKKAVYEACGVREFWRYDDAAGLQMLALQGGTYELIDTSRVVSGLPVQVVNGFVDRFTAGEKRPAIVASLQKWLLDNRHLHDANWES